MKRYSRSWPLESAGQFLRDVRYAFRNLRKSPVFAIAAVVTLALGIGANTAIFSVVQGVLLGPLPFFQPDRLVMVIEDNLTLKHEMSVSYPDLRDWQHDARAFEAMAAYRTHDYDLTGPGTSAHVLGKEISAGFFHTLGVKLTLGRDFSFDEDRQGGAPVVLIGTRLWKDRFGGGAEVLGKTLTLGGVHYAVAGVVPSEFHLEGEADAYTPLGQGSPLIVNDRTVHPGILCVARLKRNVTVAQASADMRELQNHLTEIYPAADRGVGTVVVPLKQELVGDVSGTLLMLFGAVGLVLLIACANVANLLLARSVSRGREFAIRSALGASSARVASLLIAESLLLSMVGGAAGLVIARWIAAPALSVFTGSLPRSENIGVNMPVLLFTFGLSVTAGILFGLAPVLKSSRGDLQAALKEGGRGVAGRHPRAQRVLVIFQMALTLVLLMGASLLLRSIHNLWQVNPGFNAQHILSFKVGLSPAVTETPAKMRIAYQQLTERVRQIPGVLAADLTVLLPLSHHSNSGPFLVGSQQPTYISEAPRALYYWVGPDYLRTMQIPLLRGRFLMASDTAKSEPVIVIDSALARTYFADKNPVGQIMTIPHWGVARIVGVAGHVRHWALDGSDQYTQNQIYASFYQLKEEWVPAFREDLTVIVRTPLDDASILPAIRRAVYGTEGDQPVYSVRSMQEIVSASMSTQRFPTILLGAFAGLALLLASVGIYGVISYSVNQRVQEIGIRMALGAGRPDVLRMIIGQGLRMTFIGLAVGGVAAVILMRALSSISQLLYGVRPTDPPTLVAVSLVLITVALIACYLPARGAAQLDPVLALRQE